MACRGAEEQGVAVWLGPRDVASANGGCAACLGLDDDRLLQPGFHLLGQRAGHGVGWATGSVGVNQRDRPRGKHGLRVGHRQRTKCAHDDEGATGGA
ncbi:hypothetical protein FQZ97_913760 [compost metagenome]